MPNLLTQRRVLTNLSRRPNAVQSLALWLDASDATTVTLDGSNNVSQWDDKSGNGRNVTQGVTGQRPNYATSSWCGLNAVIFDGSDDHLVSAAFPLGTFTAISVVSRNWSSNAYAGYFGHNPGSAVRASGVLGSTFTDWFAGETYAIGNGFGGSSVPRVFGSRPAVSDGTPICITARLGATSTIRVNGATNIRTVTNASMASVNATIVIGSTTTTLDRWNGRICEFAIYDRELSDSEVIAVENYMRSKWGTP